MADPVYLTINEFPGTGAPAPTVVDFNFAGGYISPAHVKAEIFAPGTYLRTPVTVTDDNFVSAFRLSLPVTVPVGSVLRVYRDTPKDQPLVDFTNGARIAENNLDLVAQQAVFVAAESADQIAVVQVADVLQAVEAAASSAALAQTSAEASANSAAFSESAATAGAADAAASALAALAAQAAAQSAADDAEAALVFRRSGIATAVDTTSTALWQQSALYPAMFGNDMQALFSAAMLYSLPVYLPGGQDYNLSAPIYAEGPRAIAVYGDGPADSRLVWTSGSGGIKLVALDGRQTFTVKDLGLYTTYAGCVGPALWLESTNLTTRPVHGASISNVVVSGLPELGQTTRYWNGGGFVFRNLPRSIVQGCLLYRYSGATGPVDPQYTAIEARGNCTPGPKVSLCGIYGFDRGISNGPNAEDNTEGVYVDQCELVAVNYGVYLDYETYTTNKGAPDIRVQNSHISPKVCSVYGHNVNSVNISGLVTIRRNDAVGDYQDIHLKKCTGVNIYDNEFSVGATANGTRTAVKLEAVTNAIIHDNRVKETARDVGITYDAACANITEHDNDWNAITTERVNLIADKAAYNIRSRLEGKSSTVRLALTQTVANNTAAYLSWNTNLAAQDIGLSGSFTAGTPTRLVVPRGVARVRLAAQVNFAASATGFRYMAIHKNGAAVSNGGEVRAPAAGSLATVVNAATAVIDVVAGDYFEVQVQHTAGADLAVQAGVSTWFELQVIA